MIKWTIHILDYWYENKSSLLNANTVCTLHNPQQHWTRVCHNTYSISKKSLLGTAALAFPAHPKIPPAWLRVISPRRLRATSLTYCMIGLYRPAEAHILETLHTVYLHFNVLYICIFHTHQYTKTYYARITLFVRYCCRVIMDKETIMWNSCTKQRYANTRLLVKTYTIAKEEKQDTTEICRVCVTVCGLQYLLNCFWSAVSY